MSDVRPIEELWGEWRDVWLDSIYHQIIEIHHRRQLHDEFLAMLEAQDHPDTTFADTFHLMYIEATVMAIRRQTDKDSRALSLRRLIGQLQDQRRRFTREAFVGRWMHDYDRDSDIERERLDAHSQHQRANGVFDQFSDEPGAPHLGSRWLADDRLALDAITAKVTTYADQRVAHVDREPEEVTVTYSDFDAAINHLGDVLACYHLLLDQSSLATPTPAIQGNWKGPFHQGLIER